MAEQTRKPKCQVENYGKCCGQLRDREVMYHCRPRSKDLTRGHEPFDQIRQVLLCDGHFKRISDDYENKQLPELYGWDFADALDGLTYRLQHTVRTALLCLHCDCKMKDTVTETGACNDTCISLTQHGAQWDHCRCNQPVTCVCESFKNNPLHWAILTYGNGFQREYECDACIRPSWRDSQDIYKSGLVDDNTIIQIAKERPNLIYKKNAHGITPIQIIRKMIDLLIDAREDEYVKSVAYGQAGHNITILEKIAKKLKEGSASP